MNIFWFVPKNQNHYGSFIFYRNVPKSNLYDSGINGTPLNFLYTDYKEAGQQVQPDRRTQLMRKYMILHWQKMNLSFLGNNKKNAGKKFHVYELFFTF